jgi:hypothetical protein
METGICLWPLAISSVVVCLIALTQETSECLSLVPRVELEWAEAEDSPLVWMRLTMERNNRGIFRGWKAHSPGA